VEEEVVDEHSGYDLDATLDFTHCGVACEATKSKRWAVEVDGPFHYLREFGVDGQQPSGSTIMKHRHLRRCGYELISIPYWEWDACGTEEAEQHKYLQRKLEMGLASDQTEAATVSSCAPTVADVAEDSVAQVPARETHQENALCGGGEELQSDELQRQLTQNISSADLAALVMLVRDRADEMNGVHLTASWTRLVQLYHIGESKSRASVDEAIVALMPITNRLFNAQSTGMRAVYQSIDMMAKLGVTSPPELLEAVQNRATVLADSSVPIDTYEVARLVLALARMGVRAPPKLLTKMEVQSAVATDRFTPLMKRALVTVGETPTPTGFQLLEAFRQEALVEVNKLTENLPKNRKERRWMQTLEHLADIATFEVPSTTKIHDETPTTATLGRLL
jgi:hypothetical protein